MKRGKKAAAIREFLAANPTAPAKEVIEALQAKGVKVSPAQVYGLKSSGSRPAKNSNGYESLIQAKKLADTLGGIDEAKAMLNVLAKIVG